MADEIESPSPAFLGGSDAEPFLTVSDSDQHDPSARCSGRRTYGTCLLAVAAAVALVMVVAAPHEQSKSVPRTANLRSIEEKETLQEMMAKMTAKAQNDRHRDSNAHDEFFSLGTGFCTDHHGEVFEGLDDEHGDSWVSDDVSADGSSAECSKKCLADANCNGYATYGSSKCALVKNKYPAWANGTGLGHCFYRHRFLRNTTGIYNQSGQPVPKKIWGYWENLAPRGSHHVPTELPPLVDICVSSWRQTNPGWEVNVLNETTKGQWLEASDLPDDYDTQIIQHKSDAVRIALLEKYGGVWIDASVLMVKPLDEILGDSSKVHTFMNLKTYYTQDTMIDRRVNYSNYVENWFMAFPPHDPVIHRTRKCVLELQPKLNPWRPLAATGMFTPVQLEEMFGLQINTYLSMHACFLRTIDEDAAIWHWVNSPSVQHLYAGDAGLRLYKLFGWHHEGALRIKKHFFEELHEELYENLTVDSVKMLKISGKLRKVVWGLSKRQLWCENTTLHKLVSSLGVENKEFCDGDA